MKIESRIQGASMVVEVNGRLDAAWAELMLDSVRDLVREGHHHVRLDASGLEYLSSAGIRSLLKIRRELESVSGSFGIAPAAPFVQETLRMAELTLTLIRQEKLTALMVTHSMQQAVQLPERIIMMHKGRVVREYQGQEKDRVRVPDLLDAFDQVRRREQLDPAVAALLGSQYC